MYEISQVSYHLLFERRGICEALLAPLGIDPVGGVLLALLIVFCCHC
jgi:hypothetical protein